MAKKPSTSIAKKSNKAKAKKVVAEIVDDDSSDDSINDSIESGDSSAPVDIDDDSENFDTSVDPIAKLPAVAGSKSLTTSTDPMATYLAEVRKYPLLTKEQEQEITLKYYETKDPKLAQVLVTSNLRFVVKVAAEYSKFGGKLIDLIQEGNMGLMHAVRDFNPYKGVRLITYAVWWIRGYIQEYMMKQYSLVKIGTTQNQKKLFYQLQREKKNLDAMGNAPDVKAISEKLGIPEDEVQMMTERMSGRDLSLNMTFDDDSAASLMDLQKSSEASPDDLLEKEESVYRLQTVIESLKPSLNQRELILLNERILSDDPLTLQEIGEKYKITREAVRQAEVRLMNKIKEKMQADS